MYHISDDIRARKSAQRICDAVLACSRHKSFADISISDLNREYGISRTTFYRLFDNTVDVLEYICDQMGRAILLDLPGDSVKELVINAISALRDRREFIELLYKSGHMDIFLRVQERYLPLSKLAAVSEFGGNSAYFHRILAQLIPTAIHVWVSGGVQDSPEQVYDELHRSVQILGKWFS